MKSIWQPAISAALALTIVLSVFISPPRPYDQTHNGSVSIDSSQTQHQASANRYETCKNKIAESGGSLQLDSGHGWEISIRDFLASQEHLKALLKDFMDTEHLDAAKKHLDEKLYVITYDALPNEVEKGDEAVPVTYFFMFCNNDLIICKQIRYEAQFRVIESICDQFMTPIDV